MKQGLPYGKAKNSFVVEVTFKLESTCTLKPNENTDSENICKGQSPYTDKRIRPSLIRKIENKEIIIKRAEKGSVIATTHQITIGIDVSPIFQIHHIIEC